VGARTATAALLAAAALGLGACGDDEEQPADSSVTPVATAPAAPTATEPATTETTQEGSSTARLDVSKDRSVKPAIPRLTGAPPTKLVIQDVVKGKGKAAREDDEITVDYVGVSYSTGTQFDASWDRGEPATFGLSKGSLIAGWLEGIPGMRPGGRRVLVIPADLAYGDSPQPGSGIEPGETLIFVIDLKKVG